MRYPLFALFFAQLSFHSSAFEGLNFYHNDWQLTCDNTGTCRAVGYQSGENIESAVALLFTRAAGEHSAVSGQLMLGEIERSEFPAQLQLQLNGKDYGVINANNGDNDYPLSQQQNEQILANAQHNTRIEFNSGEERWQVSDSGISAVLRKMDEYQGRINSASAIITKGNRQHIAPPAQAAPVIHAQPLRQDFSLLTNDSPEYAPLFNAIVASLGEDECYQLVEEESADRSLEVMVLNEQLQLVRASCWLAAYNYGSGYWLVNRREPYQVQTITLDGNDFIDGEIFASHKGRGIGDCYGVQRWLWDGKRFPLVEAYNTGSCRLVALGGIWALYQYTSEVIHQEK